MLVASPAARCCVLYAHVPHARTGVCVSTQALKGYIQQCDSRVAEGSLPQEEKKAVFGSRWVRVKLWAGILDVWSPHLLPAAVRFTRMFHALLPVFVS